MALTAQYGTPEYTIQNATDLSVALPVTIQDDQGVVVDEFVATFAVNKDNPDAKDIISTNLATQVRAAIADAQEKLDAVTAVGKDLIANVTTKVAV